MHLRKDAMNKVPRSSTSPGSILPTEVATHSPNGGESGTSDHTLISLGSHNLLQGSNHEAIVVRVGTSPYQRAHSSTCGRGGAACLKRHVLVFYTEWEGSLIRPPQVGVACIMKPWAAAASPSKVPPSIQEANSTLVQPHSGH